MNIYDRAQFDALRHDFSQKCSTNSYDLGYLLAENHQGKINTQMDIQRKYVWTEAREQEMWDSLLLNVRIPEFHAIMDGRIRNVCDGKQRFTCIFRILEDKIRYKKITARQECQWLFEYAAKPNKKGNIIIPNSIVFSQLPQEVQDNILNTQVYIASYSNLTRQEEIALFRKINNGVPLSEFSRGMASYYYMRKEFTDPLMNTSSELISIIEKHLVNDEDLETILVRGLVLCDNEDNVNLQPNGLEKYYSRYEKVTVINDWLYQFQKIFKRCSNSLEIVFQNCRSKRSIMPFILEGIYKHPELSENDIKKLCKEISSYSAGRGSDLRESQVKDNRDLVNRLIVKIKNN